MSFTLGHVGDIVLVVIIFFSHHGFSKRLSAWWSTFQKEKVEIQGYKVTFLLLSQRVTDTLRCDMEKNEKEEDQDQQHGGTQGQKRCETQKAQERNQAKTKAWTPISVDIGVHG